MSCRTIVSAVLLAASVAGVCQTAPPSIEDEPGFEAAAAAVRQALPGTAIDSVRRSPLPGLVEVVAGTNVLYADTSGRWLVVGHLYDLETATDVTAERIAATTPRAAWEDLPFDAAVHFGSGHRQVAVFSDPDCPWCRRLHAALRQASGVEVREIMYPLPGLHPQAKAKAVGILCAPDPVEALDRVMAGAAAPTTASVDCEARADEAIERAVAHAERLGIRGTPTLIAPDGRMHSGYLPSEELQAWLDAGAAPGRVAR